MRKTEKLNIALVRPASRWIKSIRLLRLTAMAGILIAVLRDGIQSSRAGRIPVCGG